MSKDLDNIFSLNNRVIVITGAIGLLGRMHAEAVAAFGGIPVLLDIKLSELNEFEAEINAKYNIESVSYVVDITDEDQVKKNAKDVVDKFGRIDGLVNNAANNPKMEDSNEKNFSRLENFPLELWSLDIAVGLTGAFLCAKHYGSIIAENKEGGSIVNISSDLGLIAPDQRLYRKENLSEIQQSVKPVTYSVVKTGLVGLTRYLATYWAENNVRCNAICPGGVENGQSEAFLKEVSARIPMNRLAKLDEFQGTLVWMLSSASSYLNGAVVPVDGGRTAW